MGRLCLSNTLYNAAAFLLATKGAPSSSNCRLDEVDSGDARGAKVKSPL